MRKVRIYVDTSVLGGVSDEEFAEASTRVLDWARNGKCVLLVSEITYRELRDAPEAARAELMGLPAGSLEEVPIDSEVEELANAYLTAGVLSAGAVVDAMHVAAATVGGADLIISWNFRHMVNYNRIRAFNGVNLSKGYGLIDIRSPWEIGDENESEDV